MYSEKQDLARYFTYLFLTTKCVTLEISYIQPEKVHTLTMIAVFLFTRRIMGMCDTPRQTQCARNYIFPHFVRVMVITVLWAELWFVVGVELCFFFKRVAWEE